MGNNILKQHYLQVLALHHERATCEVADELDIKVYQTCLLLNVQDAALHMEMSDAVSAVKF